MKDTLNTFQTYIDDFNIKLSENSDNYVLYGHISNFAGALYFRRYVYACSIYYRLGPLCVLKGLSLP